MKPRTLEEEFETLVGTPLEKVHDLYQRAIKNDWRTVQANTQQVFNRFTAASATAAEATQLLRLTRAILKGENGGHLKAAGLAEE